MNRIDICAFKKVTAATALFLTATCTYAQGIPVIDVAAIMQAIEQVRAWESQYKQMQQTLDQQAQMIQNTTGTRNLGTVFNGITGPVLPADIGQQLAGAQTHEALNAVAGANFTKLSQAMQTRASQIQGLMQQINATQDAKSIQELSARIQAEQVMATNEAKEAEWLKSQVQAQAFAIDRAQLQRMLNPSIKLTR
jgi:type IV secretion system protein VirB5